MDQNKYAQLTTSLNSNITNIPEYQYPSYQDMNQTVEQLVKLEVSNELHRQKSNIEEKVNAKLIENIIKYFKIDFGTGQEILNLSLSKDESNKIIAINMLLSEVKDKIKQEIIEQINEKG